MTVPTPGQILPPGDYVVELVPALAGFAVDHVADLLTALGFVDISLDLPIAILAAGKTYETVAAAVHLPSPTELADLPWTLVRPLVSSTPDLASGLTPEQSPTLLPGHEYQARLFTTDLSYDSADGRLRLARELSDLGLLPERLLAARRGVRFSRGPSRTGTLWHLWIHAIHPVQPLSWTGPGVLDHVTEVTL